MKQPTEYVEVKYPLIHIYNALEELAEEAGHSFVL